MLCFFSLVSFPKSTETCIITNNFAPAFRRAALPTTWACLPSRAWGATRW